ncbi:hypothetical protein BGX28_009547, partial [Mortierella sp. GBA30]
MRMILDDMWIACVDLGQTVTAAITVRVPPNACVSDSDVTDMALDSDDGYLGSELSSVGSDISMDSETDLDICSVVSTNSFEGGYSASDESMGDLDPDTEQGGSMYSDSEPELLEEDVTTAEIDYLDSALKGGKLRNLKVKHKALCQSLFRFRRVLEEKKTDEIREAETSILPRRGV